MKKIMCLILTCVLIFGLCGCLSINISVDTGKSSDSSQSDSSEDSYAGSQYADMSGYTIICVSSDGNTPVEGVDLQFCSDTKCMIGTTNAEGMANFDVADGEYDVHIQSVPDGFDMPAEAEFKMTPDNKQQTVIIPGAGADTFDSSSEYDSDANGYFDINFAEVTLVPSSEHGIISGSTFDIYGNPVDFQQLFGAANITLLNILEFECQHCYNELADLTNLNNELSKNGGQVVLMYYPEHGDEWDGSSFENLNQQNIQELLGDLNAYGAKGMQIVVYVPSVTAAAGSALDGFPSSYLVNREGRIISDVKSGEDTSDEYYNWILQHVK